MDILVYNVNCLLMIMYSEKIDGTCDLFRISQLE